MHTIRLRGPWSYETLEQFAASDAVPAEPAGDIPLPCDWRTVLPEDFAGVVRFRRWFNMPTGITEEHQLWLVIDAVYDRAIVKLSDDHLATIEPQTGRFSIDIKSRLRPRNELVIDVAWPIAAEASPESPVSGETALDPPRGLTGLVWLAIFEPGETPQLPSPTGDAVP